MYAKNDKRRLYWLIDQYLAGTLNESTFCDEFYYSYCLEIEGGDLDESEKKVFEGLRITSSRFSPHEEDHRRDAHAFSTKEELRQAILDARSCLAHARDQG